MVIVMISTLFFLIELDQSKDSPIIEISLGPNGRPERIRAKIKKHHLRPRGQARGNITARVRRFVRSLGQVVGVRDVRESDEVGHIIGDLLGGPCDRTYNFFPQSPFCNMDYYHQVESAIHDYLSARSSNDAYVEMDVQFVYVDYIAEVSPNRPRMLKVTVRYSDGTTETFEISNM